MDIYLFNYVHKFFLSLLLFLSVGCISNKKKVDPIARLFSNKSIFLPKMRIFSNLSTISEIKNKELIKEFSKKFRVLNLSQDKNEIIDVNLFLDEVYYDEIKNGVENWYLINRKESNLTHLGEFDVLLCKENTCEDDRFFFKERKLTEFMTFNERDIPNTVENLYQQFLYRRGPLLPQTYYINLDRSTERRKKMEEQSRENKLPITRFSAIDGSIFKDKYDKLGKDYIEQDLFYMEENQEKHFAYKYRKDIFPAGMGYGELALFLSDYKIIKEIVERKYPATLILEDDARLSKNFSISLSKIMEKAPKNWDVIYLYCNAHEEWGCNKDRAYKKTPNGLLRFLSPNECIAGMVAAIFSQKGAKKLYQELEGAISQPVDVILGTTLLSQKKGEFSAFCTDPELVSTGDFESELKKMDRAH